MTCAACILEKRGIKPANPPAHTCGRYPKGYVPPECHDARDHQDNIVKFYKVFILLRIKQTDNATLYQLAANQYLNGYKVPGGVEKWFPNKLFHDGSGEQTNTKRPEQWIWVHEKIYNDLTFIK